jgi:hypothetical protein
MSTRELAEIKKLAKDLLARSEKAKPEDRAILRLAALTLQLLEAQR